MMCNSQSCTAAGEDLTVCYESINSTELSNKTACSAKSNENVLTFERIRVNQQKEQLLKIYHRNYLQRRNMYKTIGKSVSITFE